MDITADFGSAVPGSSPGRGTIREKDIEQVRKVCEYVQEAAMVQW